MRTTFVFKGNCRKTIAPGIRFGKGHAPQLLGRWVLRHFAFCTRFHIDAVDTLPIGCICVANLQFFRVVLCLSDSFGKRYIPCFGFDDRKLGVAIDQNIVRSQPLATSAETFEPSWCDNIFTTDATSLDDAPATRGQRGIDVFRPSFSLVHGPRLSTDKRGGSGSTFVNW